MSKAEETLLTAKDFIQNVKFCDDPVYVYCLHCCRTYFLPVTDFLRGNVESVKKQNKATTRTKTTLDLKSEA